MCRERGTTTKMGGLEKLEAGIDEDAIFDVRLVKGGEERDRDKNKQTTKWTGGGGEEKD
jgi:hypothetical protein